jgi:hypothetical protein
LRQAHVRVEQRLDGSLAARHGERYLPVKEGARGGRDETPTAKQHRVSRRGSERNRDFDRKKAPKIWQAAQESGHRRGGDIG